MRIGVAGLGFGASVQVPALRSLEGVEVVGLSGRDRGKTRDVAARLGIPKACVGIDELLGLGLDAVTLALPPVANEKAALAVLAARVPLLCEKPVSASVDAAMDLVAAASGITAMVDFEFGELETFKTLKEQVQEQAHGPVRHVEVSWTAPSWALRSGAWGWKLDQRAGGGVLPLLGSHVLYLFEWLFGPVEVRSASCSARATAAIAPEGESPAPDTYRIELVASGDCSITIDLSNAPDVERRHEWFVTFENERAIARNLSDDWVSGFTLILEKDPEVMVATDPATGDDGRIGPVAALARRFVDAAARGISGSPSLQAGARVQELMATIENKASAL